LIEQLAAPARAVGGFRRKCPWDTFVKIFRRPLSIPGIPRSDLDDRAGFSLIPTAAGRHPRSTVLVAFTPSTSFFREIGAADLSGAGTAFGTIHRSP